MTKTLFLVTAMAIAVFISSAQERYADEVKKITAQGLTDLGAYAMLKDLTTNIGSRLSGSEQYQKAVQWGKRMMEERGFDSIWLEPVSIPHWVRGNVEEAFLLSGKTKLPLHICALGGSVGTPKSGIRGKVYEVKSFEEVAALGNKLRGAIVFYNRPFDQTLVNTGAAYGGAVNQRSRGAIEAAKYGAVAVLVRSMTNALDDVPHTGMMSYDDSVPKIPAAAISTVGANNLSTMIKKDPSCMLEMKLSCETLPDVDSYNVVGEIRGSEKPEEVIVVGGHLDSWDKGQGAHDDGAGVVQSIECVTLLKKLGLTPKRTIRAVLFANEENGSRGGKAYAGRDRKNEKPIAAIESDMGGFQPRSFGVNANSTQFEKIKNLSYLFENLRCNEIKKGEGGVDIGPLRNKKTVLIGMYPESQRYFDYHHSDHDTIDKVHPRELELGAIAMAILSYALAQEGI